MTQQTLEQRTSTAAIARNSETWWAETKRSPELLGHWLTDQLRGESTAGDRIEALRDHFCTPKTRAYKVLSTIAKQERLHAQWVKQLLLSRGLPTDFSDVQERYWVQTLAAYTDTDSANPKAELDFETGCAIGAHAEKMRLERIEAIANDPDAPEDIRAVFAKILPQERFHERAFRSLSSDTATQNTLHAHELGLKLLGLSA